LVFLLEATMTEAPSAEAALAVAMPNPEVPPIMTSWKNCSRPDFHRRFGRIIFPRSLG
jgi:hypothetical protein